MHRHTLPLLIMLLLTAACTGPATDRALNRAETLIDTAPDSAAAILDSIAPHIGRSASRLAAHTALTAHTHHLTGLTPLPIGQLRQASQHYRMHPTPTTTRHALAHYHLALAINQTDTLTAQTLLTLNHAAQAAAAIPNHHLLGLIYRQIADIYITTHNATDQLYYAKLSLNHFQQAHSTPHAQYALLDLAIAHNNAQNYDSCLTIIDDVITQAISIGEYPLLHEAIGMKSAAYVATKNYPEAICLYKQLLLAINGNLTNNQLRDLSLAFVLHNQPDSAKIYLDRYAICADTTDSLRTYYDYNLATGNYKDAIEGLLADLQTQNRAYSEAMTQNVSTAMREYRDYELQLHKNRIKLHRNTLISISIIAISIILTLIFLIKTLHTSMRHKQTVIDQTIAAAQELTIRLNHANSTIANIFPNQYAMITELCNTYYESSHSPKLKNKIYDKVMHTISAISSDATTLLQLENTINESMDNLFAKFRQDYPNLKPQQYRMFLYLVMGLSAQTISTLLSIKITSLYTLKSNLKAYIIEHNSPHRTLYTSFL